MPETLTYSVTLTKISCGVCHIPFALPSSLYTTLVETGRWFHCPNGDRIHYYEDENSKLKAEATAAERRLASVRAQLDQARADRDHQEARVHGYQGALAKTKKRAAKGVCPVPACKRHFVDVQRHVASQHPDWCAAD